MLFRQEVRLLVLQAGLQEVVNLSLPHTEVCPVPDPPSSSLYIPRPHQPQHHCMYYYHYLERRMKIMIQTNQNRMMRQQRQQHK